VTRLAELLSDIQAILVDHSDTPGLDAQVLVAQSLAKPRSWVLAHPEAVVTDEQQAIIQASLARLKTGEPFTVCARSLGILRLDFLLTPATLIPRPETELLVDHALGWLRDHPKCPQCSGHRYRFQLHRCPSLARHIPDLKSAVDSSFPALITAQNAFKAWSTRPDRIRSGDLVLATINRFDLLCAQPSLYPLDQLAQLKISGKEHAWPWMVVPAVWI
jgi:release factor glutamine methyltransferase